MLGSGLPSLSVFTSPVLNLPLPEIQLSRMSSAVIGTPSDHLAAALMVYSMVNGLLFVTVQVMNWSLFTTLRSLS